MISEREAAKYPFLKDSVSLVDMLDISLEDLSDPTQAKVLDRALERVNQAILTGESEAKTADPITELLSFPVANMFVSVIGDDFLTRRYALSEALRANGLLLQEGENRLAKMARNEYSWDLKLRREQMDGILYNYEVAFGDYIRNASSFKEGKWKLVNRLVRDGYVLLTRADAARLLKEDIQRSIRGMVENPIKLTLPEPLQKRLNQVKKTLEENRGKLTGGELPAEVIMEALPPCIEYAYQGLLQGRRAGHMERFALTSFLINAGMNIDDIVKLFTSVTDFDEEFTRYQIEHIAGIRGGRTRYTPPTCATLRTHGVCINTDRICERVKHPLSYYRRKLWSIQKREEERAERELQAEERKKGT